MLRRQLFLDLEDTVITPVVNGWFNVQLINVSTVRAVIRALEPHSVNIFSFAVWNQHERSRFLELVKPWLQDALGVQLDVVPTMDDDIIPICCRELGISPDRTDFSDISDFLGKAGAFRLFVRHHAKRLRAHGISLHATLLDDAVFDEHLHWPDLDAKASIFNIDNLHTTLLCHPSSTTT